MLVLIIETYSGIIFIFNARNRLGCLQVEHVVVTHCERNYLVKEHCWSHMEIKYEILKTDKNTKPVINC